MNISEFERNKPVKTYRAIKNTTKKYKNVIYEISGFQNRIKNHIYADKMPLTGNFIDCRDSIINWCPIGRNANSKQRNEWLEIDKKYNARMLIIENYFKNNTLFNNLSIKLGGETSFDIYPVGWDKTFVLNNFSEDDNIWFVGDKCTGTGNDKEIYDKLAHKNKAYQTSSVKNTITIIEKIINEETKWKKKKLNH